MSKQSLFWAPPGCTLHLGLVEPRREREPVQRPVHTMQPFKATQPEMVFHLVKVAETNQETPPKRLLHRETWMVTGSLKEDDLNSGISTSS